VTVVGGVFSQAEGFAGLNELWPGLAFHAVTMALGTGLLGKGLSPKRTAQAAPLPEKL
jgi:hypothetical protein